MTSKNIPFNQHFINTTRDSFYRLLPSEIGLSDFQNLARAQLIAAANNQKAADPTEHFHRLLAQRPQIAADALTHAFLNAGAAQAQRLSFVRHVDASYRSPLGNRKWAAGISAMGSVRETQSDVIAWQTRGFAGDDATTGANVGIIYRSIVHNNTALLGGNVFLDYEDGDYGSFSRYSFGVEGKAAFADVYANRYEPLGDDNTQTDSRIAYSKAGWDMGVRAHWQNSRMLRGGIAYYNYEGKYGDEDDSGFQFHVGIAPPQLAGLDVQLEYDEASGDFGGGLSYRHRLGAAVQSKQRGENFNPKEHFYAPVQREFSQRIGVAETTADGFYVMLPADTNARAGIQINGDPITANTVYATSVRLDIETGANGFELTRPAGWYVTIGANTQLAYENSTISITAGFVGYRSLGANKLSAIVADLGSNEVTISLLGTEVLVTIDNNRVSIHAIQGEINLGDAAAGDVVLQVADDAAVEWGSQRYDGDSNLAISPAAITLLSSQGTSGSSAGQLVASGGGSGLTYTYELVGTHSSIAVANNGALTFSANTSDDTNITIRARTVNGGFSTLATINIRFLDSLSLQNPPDSNPSIIENVASPVITLSVSGGLAPYAYAFIGTPPSGFQISHSGGDEVTLAVAAQTFPADTFTLSLTIHSAAMLSDITPEVTLDITPAINFASVIPALNVAANDTSNFANLASYIQDGSGAYTYTIISDSSNALQIGNNGMLSFSPAITQDSEVMAVVEISDISGTLTATLNINVYENVALNDAIFNIATGASGVIGTITPAGSGSYTFTANNANVAINDSNGEVTWTTASNSADTIMVEVVVTDTNNNTTATAMITIIITDAVAANDATYNTYTGFSGALGTITPSAGSGTYTYAESHADISIASNGEVRLVNAQSAVDTIVVEVEITDTTNNSTATIMLTINVTTPVNIANQTYNLATGNSSIGSITPTGGSGNVSYTTNNSNVIVADNGSITFVTAPSSAETIEVVITATDTNGSTDTATIIIIVVEPLQFTDDSIDLILQGNQHENTAVLTLATQGGSGSHNIVLESANPNNWSTLFNFDTTSNSNRLTLTDNGAVDNGGGATLIFAVTDDSNQTAQATLTISIPRRLHIIGGDDASTGFYSDVWASTNGKQWHRKTDNAGFGNRSGHRAVVLNSTLYVIGGRGSSSSYYNDVWSSTDGETWTQETANAGFAARQQHRAVVLNNTMYVMGGNGASNALYQDVWSSSDGASWALVTATAAFGTRYGHSAAAFNNKIYVVGGRTSTGHTYTSDVWSSSDGETWTRDTANAAFSNRYVHDMAVFSNAMYVVGGFDSSFAYQGDVWSSTDGNTWTESTADVGFSRANHALITFGNKLYLIAGVGAAVSAANDVWSSTNGTTWTQETADGGFPARVSHAALLFP